MKKLKIGMTQYGIAGQLQQRPAPQGGGYIKREWFEIIDESPFNSIPMEQAMEKGKRFIRWWDPAATEADTNKDPDYFAGALVSELGGIFYVENVIRFRKSPHASEKMVKQTAQIDSVLTKIRMEQEPGSGGKITISHYARNILKGYDFRGIPSTKAKGAYIDPFAAAAENGLVKLVKGAWNSWWLDEVEVWPNGAHDDSVEAAAKGYIHLCKPSQWWGYAETGDEN